MLNILSFFLLLLLFFFFFGEIIVDFPTETLILRRAWSEVFQELKENNFSPKILYPAKLSFKTEGE
jgi:hypothetical protein